MTFRLPTLLTTLLLISPIVGCALPPGIRENLLDPGKRQRERKEEITRMVEDRHLQSHLKAASALVESGRYEECIHELDELEKDHPHSKEIHLLRAEVLMAQSQYPAAAEIYDRLARDYPGDANLHHLHAIALEFSGDSAGAILAFQRAAELSPDSSVIQLSQLRQAPLGTTNR